MISHLKKSPNSDCWLQAPMCYLDVLEKPGSPLSRGTSKHGIVSNAEHILDKLKVSFVHDICARGALSFTVNITLQKSK